MFSLMSKSIPFFFFFRLCSLSIDLYISRQYSKTLRRLWHAIPVGALSFWNYALFTYSRQLQSTVVVVLTTVSGLFIVPSIPAIVTHGRYKYLTKRWFVFVVMPSIRTTPPSYSLLSSPLRCRCPFFFPYARFRSPPRADVSPSPSPRQTRPVSPCCNSTLRQNFLSYVRK